MELSKEGLIPSVENTFQRNAFASKFAFAHLTEPLDLSKWDDLFVACEDEQTTQGSAVFNQLNLSISAGNQRSHGGVNAVDFEMRVNKTFGADFKWLISDEWPAPYLLAQINLLGTNPAIRHLFVFDKARILSILQHTNTGLVIGAPVSLNIRMYTTAGQPQQFFMPTNYYGKASAP